MLVEVCVSSIEDVFTVKQSHADRVELCAVMEVIGVTPSLGSFLYAKKHIDLPIVVMIRPRAGGFNYTDHEFETMLIDIEQFKKHGATRFVFGILNDANEVDYDRCKKIVEAIGPNNEIVFHKAFDYIHDKDEAVVTLIELGVTRILTAGGSGSTMDNIDELRLLMNKYKNKIEFLPGGGINKDNIMTLKNELDMDQVHLSAKHMKNDIFDYIATDEQHLKSFVELVKE